MENNNLIIADSPEYVQGVTVIALNRPEKRNALSKAMITAFLGALRQASADSNVKVIVVTGCGSCFSGQLRALPRGLGTLLTELNSWR